MHVNAHCVICLVFETLEKTRVRIIAVCSAGYEYANCIVRLVNAVCKSRIC